MSMQDPISDMLTRIRNGQLSRKKKVSMFGSKIKIAIASLLKREGFIKDFKVFINIHSFLVIYLKYFKNKPVIEKIKRISRPGLRVYKKNNNIPKIMDGMGVVILSTSLGIITDRFARKIGIGGEIICYIE